MATRAVSPFFSTRRTRDLALSVPSSGLAEPNWAKYAWSSRTSWVKPVGFFASTSFLPPGPADTAPFSLLAPVAGGRRQPVIPPARQASRARRSTFIGYSFQQVLAILVLFPSFHFRQQFLEVLSPAQGVQILVGPQYLGVAGVFEVTCLPESPQQGDRPGCEALGPRLALGRGQPGVRPHLFQGDAVDADAVQQLFRRGRRHRPGHPVLDLLDGQGVLPGPGVVHGQKQPEEIRRGGIRAQLDQALELDGRLRKMLFPFVNLAPHAMRPVQAVAQLGGLRPPPA